MILDDLFEAGLPPNIKKSDVPPGMRAPLTMRDIEAERPKSPFQYRVGDKMFMDLRAAQEFAKGTGEKVMPIQMSEQQVDEALPRTGNPVSVGYMYIEELKKARRSEEPITLDYGTKSYVLNDPRQKTWLVNQYEDAKKKGNVENFLINMGTLQGFQALINLMRKAGLVGEMPADQAETAQQRAAESADQKKNPEIKEALRGPTTARTQRMLDRIRARQPQATSDIEAMAYDIEDQRQRDRQDIERLDKERDDLERDVKADLEKEIQGLRQRRGSAGELGTMSGRDAAQDQAIAKIIQLDKQQQQAIDDLEKMVKRPAERPAARPDVSPARPSAVAQPSASEPQAAPTATAAEPVAEPAPTPGQPQPEVIPRDQTPPVTTKQRARRGKKARVGVEKPSAKDKEKIVPFKLEPAPKGQVGTDERPNDNVIYAKDLFTRELPGLGSGEKVTRKKVANLKEQSITERDLGHKRDANPRIQRILDTLRARYPQAKDDLEALLLSYRADQAHDQREINRLDAENDQEEADIDELQSMIDAIRRRRELAEKKKPTPTNADLWSRAKAAARSKFDVYPSAYANAWAAKWYKAKGGGWRMGKGAKKD